MADLTLYLLRHGESEGNVARILDSRKLNAPLAATGQVQVQGMARLLEGVELAAAYASPLIRTRMTAEAVCLPHGLSPVPTDRLIEVDIGRLDGGSQDDPDTVRPFMDVLARWEDGHPDAAFPGGETLEDVRRRFSAFLGSLDGLDDGRVLAVGHGLLFAAVIWLFCTNRPGALAEGFMGPGALSVIRTHGEMAQLLAFNVTPGTPPGSVHLP